MKRDLTKKYNAFSKMATLSLMIFSATSTQALADDMFVNMVPELAPSATQKSLPIYNNAAYLDQNTCALNYSNTSSVIGAIPTDPKALYRVNNIWKVSNWLTPLNFCISGASAVNVGSTVAIKPPLPYGGVPESLSLNPSYVRMAMRSVDQYHAIYGNVYFRDNATAKKNWPHLLLSNRISQRKITDYSSINIRFDAALRSESVNRSYVPGTNPPYGARRDYVKSMHSTQFALILPLLWQDVNCINQTSCPNFGKYVHFALKLYDDREQFFGDDSTQNVWMGDDATGMYMYRQTPRPFLVGGSTLVNNPYRTVDSRALASGNLLPYFRKALLEGEKQGKLPARLSIGSRKETDDEYLSHYSMTNVILGYEVTGLSSVVFDIYELSIRGVKK